MGFNKSIEILWFLQQNEALLLIDLLNVQSFRGILFGKPIMGI